MNPSVTWEGSSSSGDLELNYGVDASAVPTTDLASLPRRIWGTASTNVAGWGVTARAEKDVAGGGDTSIEIDANNDDADLSINAVASAGDGINFSKVSANKGLDLNGASLNINPRHDLESGDTDVVVSYDNGGTNVVLTASADSQEVTVDHTAGDTNIKLTASADDQEVTITQKMGANTISPTFNNAGDISVAWERDLGDDGSLTATLKPDESLDVEWVDGDWTASVNCGLDGINVSGADVSIKRDITF